MPKKLHVVPLTLAQANLLISLLHWHHAPVTGHRFSIGLKDAEDNYVGACVIGRPVSREVDQYEVAEVTRLVTDGSANACSMLYSTAARICRGMGFLWIQTFILESEPGTSLKASGWEFDSMSSGGTWNRPSRDGRREDQPLVKKQKWVKRFQLTGSQPVG